MAEAKKSTKTFTTMVETEVTEERVILDLSIDEASILRALLGGCKRESLTSPIFKALTGHVGGDGHKVVAMHRKTRPDTLEVIPSEPGDWW